MDGGALPDDVQALLRDRIESFEQLETLLLLLPHPDESWTSQSVSDRLRIAPAMADESLEHLRHGSLLEVNESGGARLFRYRPGTPALDAAARSLARTYVERRIDVMTCLSTNAVERVRSGAIRMFADAFLIRGRKKDG